MTPPADTGAAAAGTPPRDGTGAVRSAARNSVVGALGAATASATGFLFAVLVGRTLGAGSAGTFFSCVAVAMVLITLACAGADTGLLWALARDRAAHGGRHGRRVLRHALLPVVATSGTLAVALFLSAGPLAALISDGETPEAPAMVRATAVAVLAGPLLLCLVQGSRGLGNVLPFTLVQQVAVPLGRVGLLGAVVVVLSPGGTAVMAAWAAPLVVLLPVAATVALRRSRPRPPGDPRPGTSDGAALDFRGFWRYSLLRAVGTTASMALTWLDVVVVAALASPAEAGVYAAASRFAASGQLGLQAMRLGIGPGVAAAFARGDRRTVQELYNLSSHCATLLSWPIFWTLALFAPTALGWFGAGFAQGGTALVVLCVAMMLSVVSGNVGTVLLMSGHSGWATRNTLLALLSTIGLDVLLVPGLGATGAAIGWTAGVLVENGLGLWLVVRRLGIRPSATTLALVTGGVTLASWAAAAVGLALGGQSSAGILVTAVLAVPGALAIGYLLRRRLRLGMLRRQGAPPAPAPVPALVPDVDPEEPR